VLRMTMRYDVLRKNVRSRKDPESSVVCYNNAINDQCADTRHDYNYHAASLWRLQGTWIVQTMMVPLVPSALCSYVAANLEYWMK